MRCHPEGCDEALVLGPGSLMKFNKAKGKILHLGQGYPKDRHKLGKEWIENSPKEKDLGVLVDKKLTTTQQCVLAAQKTNLIPGWIKRTMASRSRKVAITISQNTGIKQVTVAACKVLTFQ
ncbi:hypothetical protein WISP_52648 [Willisornis vidua]|uniref:Rna-directed dna polymerase from mobile element jockey-like n=1 Tax=Willisornis vidua TaxID=1566151 RepID=A0ABQ9DDY3_9PASS|nr:hypothetical protein WISP_52648 [Willisornis vidua]